MQEPPAAAAGEQPIPHGKGTEISRGDTQRHLLELDALRGVAILCVVVCHVVASWSATTGESLTLPLVGINLTNALISIGPYGLWLFFLLSGYLLTWTEEKRADAGRYSLRSYGLRRFLRIAPAYYVAIVAVALVTSHPHGLADVAIHATFLHALTPWGLAGLDPVWWSISAEVVFYALLPLLVLKLRSTRARLLMVAICFLVACATRLTLLGEVGRDEVWVLALPSTVLWVFIVGVLLRGMAVKLDRRMSGPAMRPLAVLSVLSLVLLLVLPFVGPPDYFVQAAAGQRTFLVSDLLTDLAVILAIALVFGCLVAGSPLLRRLLNVRVLAFFGVMSYSVFLLHNTVILLLAGRLLGDEGRALGGSVWATFVLFLLAVLVVAGGLGYLSYRYIESPFLQRKPA